MAICKLKDKLKFIGSAVVVVFSGRTLHIHFLRSPMEILGNKGNVSAIRLEHTELKTLDISGERKATGTGRFEDIPAQLVLESIGYRAEAMEGAPFDPIRGIIPNELGQVMAAPGSKDRIPGLFVCGWLKRGPTGIIGTNLIDAEQTVDTMVRRIGAEDTFLATMDGTFSGGDGLAELLDRRGYLSNVISFEDWETIDAQEIRRGQLAGKPREKFASIEEMVRASKGNTTGLSLI